MNTIIRYFVGLSAAVFFGGCSAGPDAIHPQLPNSKPPGAHLGTDEAIRIAKLAAERRGVSLDDFKKPVAYYEPQFKGESWIVHFDGKDDHTPGNFFDVFVDDQTGKTKLMGGR